MRLRIIFPSKVFIKAVEWLEKNGKNGYDEFDYPDYAGMPKHIHSKLSSDEVDKIQEHWEEVKG